MSAVGTAARTAIEFKRGIGSKLLNQTCVACNLKRSVSKGYKASKHWSNVQGKQPQSLPTSGR